MSTYAIIRDSDNVVDNTILWDGDETVWRPAEGFHAVAIEDSDPCSPGDTHDPETGTFDDSTRLTPVAISATDALGQLSQLQDQVTQLIDVFQSQPTDG